MVRVDIVETPEEFAAIGHLRGWCHNLDLCPICKVQSRAHDAERRLESVISG